MIRIGFSGLVIAFAVTPARAQPVELEAAVEYFTWSEHSNGEQLLDEGGFRYAMAANYSRRGSNWIARARAKLFLGFVDYNGAIQNLVTGETIPFEDSTNYYGGGLEAHAAHQSALGNRHLLEVGGGLGADLWFRILAPGEPTGYTERWLPVFAILDATIRPARATGWIARAGIKLPFVTFESVHLEVAGFGSTDVSLRPKLRPSGFADFGYQVARSVGIVAYFDSYWFGESNPDGVFLQPESRSLQVGVRAGWTP